MQDYIDAGDRGEEPHYVGRQSLFGRVDSMRRGATRGQPESRTIVIGGAPGAGKTAFVRELIKRTNASGKALAVELDPDTMTGIGLFGALRKRTGTAMRNERTRSGGGSLSLGAVKAESRVTSVAPSDRRIIREDGGGVPWDLIRQRFGDHLPPGRPILLLCDEAQAMKPSPALE